MKLLKNIPKLNCLSTVLLQQRWYYDIIGGHNVVLNESGMHLIMYSSHRPQRHRPIKYKKQVYNVISQ